MHNPPPISPSAGLSQGGSPPALPIDPRLDSEHYRQALVKDGDRRFGEWHTAFLGYQRRFLQAMKENPPSNLG